MSSSRWMLPRREGKANMASASIPPTTLTNTYATVLTVAAGQTWRIQFSAVSNSGTSAQDLFVQIVDSSSSTTRLLVPGTPIPAKFQDRPIVRGRSCSESWRPNPGQRPNHRCGNPAHVPHLQ